MEFTSLTPQGGHRQLIGNAHRELREQAMDTHRHDVIRNDQTIDSTQRKCLNRSEATSESVRATDQGTVFDCECCFVQHLADRTCVSNLTGAQNIENYCDVPSAKLHQMFSGSFQISAPINIDRQGCVTSTRETDHGNV